MFSIMCALAAFTSQHLCLGKASNEVAANLTRLHLSTFFFWDEAKNVTVLQSNWGPDAAAQAQKLGLMCHYQSQPVNRPEG